jgi:DNA-directed RNA polymerase II subunit RPB7
MGIFAEVGPLNCFVSQQVRATRPLPNVLDLIAIPNFPQLLHPDLKFDPSSNPPSYTSQDQVSASDHPPQRRMWKQRLQVIENNTKIRIKIIGTRVDATEIVRVVPVSLTILPLFPVLSL